MEKNPKRLSIALRMKTKFLGAHGGTPAYIPKLTSTPPLFTCPRHSDTLLSLPSLSLHGAPKRVF